MEKGIVEGLVEAVDAVLNTLYHERGGTRSRIRNAIREYFKDYEEVEARSDHFAEGHVVTERATGFTRYGAPRFRILIAPPEPETVTVRREILALLKEKVEEIPDVDDATRRALREANEKL